jgi:glucosylceramidase
LTPQNEPEFPAPWEACAYDSNYEKDFINQYLGPTIRQNNPDVLLLAFDHNKDHLFAWAQDIIGGDLGSKGGYVDGMAFHWYTGSMDRYLFILDCFAIFMSFTIAVFFIFTDACLAGPHSLEKKNLFVDHLL